MKLYIIILLLIPFIFSIDNTFIGKNKGDWFNDSNWSLNRIPIYTDNVYIYNKQEVTVHSYATLKSNNITLVNSSLDIKSGGYGVFNNLINNYDSMLHVNNSELIGNIYNYGSIIINEKCHHTKNIYNSNGNMVLNYGSSLVINGSMIDEIGNVTFYSVDRDHWYKASFIHANRIMGNTTLTLLKDQITNNNQKFCWTILNGNYITGEYILDNQEYKHSSVIKQDIYVWICLDSYYV